MTYKKFRGRGKGADEKVFGADGIVEVQIEDRDTGTKFGKGVLFQAKKRGDRRRAKLLEQAGKMEEIVRQGSAIFEYGPNEYVGYDASTLIEDHVAEVNGNPRDHVAEDDGNSRSRLGDYLAERFLPCGVGKRGMYYDAVGRAIVHTNERGELIRARATLRHRLRIEVVAE